MSNCAWCNKYGAVKFHSFDNGKKQYSQQKFCSKKCLAEYEQNNNTVKWYDAKYEDESAASQQRQNLANAAEYEKVRKKVKNFFSKFAIIATLLGLSGLTQFQTNSRGVNNFWAILILIGGIYIFKRLKSNESLIELKIKVVKIILRLRYVILVAVIVSTLWGILTLFQTKWNNSDAPKKYAISIIFISIGIFYFYKKIKSKKILRGNKI